MNNPPELFLIGQLSADFCFYLSGVIAVYGALGFRLGDWIRNIALVMGEVMFLAVFVIVTLETKCYEVLIIFFLIISLVFALPRKFFPHFIKYGFCPIEKGVPNNTNQIISTKQELETRHKDNHLKEGE